MGEFNANVLRENALFASHLKNYCTYFNYVFSGLNLLPPDTYTYTSDAWGSHSWLDFIIATEDGHKLIKEVSVLYGLSCYCTSNQKRK